jgi:hypothetical protein
VAVSFISVVLIFDVNVSVNGIAVLFISAVFVFNVGFSVNAGLLIEVVTVAVIAPVFDGAVFKGTVTADDEAIIG